MNIVSQDKETIVNYENIEAIGIGCPLENNEGKFLILVNTSSDNQYTIAKYNTEERAKEVLQKIKQTKSDFEYYKYADESKRNELDSFMKTKYKFFDTYEMPKE